MGVVPPANRLQTQVGVRLGWQFRRFSLPRSSASLLFWGALFTFEIPIWVSFFEFFKACAFLQPIFSTTHEERHFPLFVYFMFPVGAPENFSKTFGLAFCGGGWGVIPL